jgi:hypothetical protein
VLGPQLFIGTRPTKERFVRPASAGFIPQRPGGGLWTSTFTKGTSAWLENCRVTRTYQRWLEHSWWLLKPNPQAKILEIRTLDDLREAAKRWPRPDECDPPAPDFPALEAAGYWSVHDPGEVISAWETESTWWLRYDFFTSCKELERPA